MGGSFFDSDSSSSESFTTESDSEYAKEHHHRHYVPSRDENGEVASGGRGPLLFFVIFAFGVFLVGFCNKDANGNAISVFKLQVC